MMNYDHLEALEAVVREGTFFRAARALHITQSAVSQRIRSLEIRAGAPVLIREEPIQLTVLGRALLEHVREVKKLESTIFGGENAQMDLPQLRVRLGVNVDSLATWFFEAVAPVLKSNKASVELLVDNEEHTLELLRRGEVSGCVSSRSKPVPGATSEELGKMSYLCVCTPQFKNQFFARGFTKDAIGTAPTLIFDFKDTLHDRFIRAFFSGKLPRYPYHLVPSNEGFLEGVLSGAAYGMIPSFQANQYLKIGRLIDLGPGTQIDVRLHLHWVLRQSAALKRIQNSFLLAGRDTLRLKK